MLTAVSLLSPVSIHIFIPAFRNACIVSGTPSCRRSSMPVAPLFRQADGLALLYFKNQVCKRDRTRESLCVSTFQTSCCAFGIKNNRRMEYLISWQYVKLTVLHLTSYRKSFDKKKKKRMFNSDILFYSIQSMHTCILKWAYKIICSVNDKVTHHTKHCWKAPMPMMWYKTFSVLNYNQKTWLGLWDVQAEKVYKKTPNFSHLQLVILTNKQYNNHQ